MPRTIKRYANRKLYDTTQSCYVTLDEIAELVKEGEDVRIIDNTSKEDLTPQILAQILFEAEKRKKKNLPLATLRQLIQSGGELFEKTITRPVVSVRDESVRRVTAARDAIARAPDDARDRVTHFIESTQKAFEEFQARVDDNLRTMMASLTQLKSPGGDLAQITARLDTIEAQLAALQECAQEGQDE